MFFPSLFLPALMVNFTTC